MVTPPPTERDNNVKYICKQELRGHSNAAEIDAVESGVEFVF
jgi:hypothetical protein